MSGIVSGIHFMKNLKHFEEYQVSISIFSKDLNLFEVETWLTDMFGPYPEGWRKSEYTTLIKTFGLNSEADLVLFKLRWAEYCI